MNFWKAFGAAALTITTYSITPANAAVLVGSATLQNSNDLTVIKDGKLIYEFLDLTVTSGRSQSSALATFGEEGFVVASNVDMARLFSSFGIDYAGRRARFADLGATKEQAATFISYLGNNLWGVDSLGTFIDLEFGQSVACVAVSGCLPRSFVSDIDRSAGWLGFGVYLVRTASTEANEVPEPAPFALLGLGAIAFAAARRHNK